MTRILPFLRALTHCLTLVAFIAVQVPLAALAATKVGEIVRITLKDGSLVQGRLVAETSNGFLVAVGGQNVVVLFADVARVGNGETGPKAPPVGATPAAAPTPPATPTPPAAAPTPRVETIETPARPRRSGLGLVIPGWILVGLGGFLAFVGFAAASGDRDCDDSGFNSGCDGGSSGGSGVAVFGLLHVLAGGVMVLIGYSKMSDSAQRIRDWEEKYGEPHPDRDSSNVQLLPIIGHETQGVGLSFTF